MLPFGVKVAWFVLSITGSLASIPVHIAFAQAVNVRWIPLSYFLANTLLQGAFLSGMIWKMDPFQMPRWFCLTQTILIAFGAFVLTGICITLAIATTRAVYRPSEIRDFRTLGWRPIYWLILGVFPVCASAVQITVLVRFDATKPSDDMHCDASNPIWPRLFSYAGVPMLEVVPCFILTLMTSWRLYHRPRILNSATVSNTGVSPNAVQISIVVENATSSSPLHSPRQILEKIYPQSPTSPRPKSYFSWRENEPEVLTPTSSTLQVSDDPESADLSDPSCTGAPPMTITHVVTEEPAPPYSAERRKQIIDSKPSKHAEDELGDSLSVDSPFSQTKGDLDPEAVEMQNFDQQTGVTPRLYRMDLSSHNQKQRSSAFGPAIWRLLWFQFMFSIIEFLATLSTLIDLASGRKTPTPFGTQHIALIGAAWGPCVFWIHLPGVYKRLYRWLSYTKLVKQ